MRSASGGGAWEEPSVCAVVSEVLCQMRTPVDDGVPALAVDILEDLYIEDLGEVALDKRELLLCRQVGHFGCFEAGGGR